MTSQFYSEFPLIPFELLEEPHFGPCYILYMNLILHLFLGSFSIYSLLNAQTYIGLSDTKISPYLEAHHAISDEKYLKTIFLRIKLAYTVYSR